MRQQGGLLEMYFILFYIKFERQVIYEVLVKRFYFHHKPFSSKPMKVHFTEIPFFISPINW